MQPKEDQWVLTLDIVRQVYDIVDASHLVCNWPLTFLQDQNIYHEALLENVVVSFSDLMLYSLLR